jgi:diguanylate cyclase (GGDEF)-like protein
MFLDLDNFKSLNDAHGHDVGDLLLIEAAKRITSCVRESDTVARFGGDEFVVILSQLNVKEAASSAQARIVAEKIRVKLSNPYFLTVQQDGDAKITIEHRCTSSIGMVLFMDHETPLIEIIKRADSAMYQGKAAGRNSIRFYDENK